jgi:hypothetical protein
MTSNISYSDQIPLTQNYSYFNIYYPSHSCFHVIPYKYDEYLNCSTKAVTNKPRFFLLMCLTSCPNTVPIQQFIYLLFRLTIVYCVDIIRPFTIEINILGSSFISDPIQS